MNDTLTHRLRTVDLERRFGSGLTEVRAVRGVDLELAPGEIVLLMGPSGSGKTTLLTMLGGLLRPTSGEVWIDDVDMAQLGERALPPFRASSFGFIFQDFNLLSALTARENIEIALNIAGTHGKTATERTDQLLGALDLQDRARFPVDQLSGGERQRVAIGRALANRPRVILADEPTANLDAANGAVIMRLLQQLAHDEKTTVLIASHDSRLQEIADRILWLEDGSLKQIEGLLTDPNCGMLVDPAKATMDDGLAFCSEGCRTEYHEHQAKAST